VVHALAHGLVLSGHQAGGLRARQAQRVFEARAVQPEQHAGRGRRRMGAEHRARMPAARQHLDAVQAQAHARADLEAGDRAQHEAFTRHAAGHAARHAARPAAQMLGASQQRRQHQRSAVQRRAWVEVVQLEALDEGAVEQRGAGRAGGEVPADHRARALAFHRAHDLRRGARPGQLRADDGAGHAVEQQVLGALAHVGGHAPCR
jgi:hypothetical protein